jgi:hypothetical protein
VSGRTIWRYRLFMLRNHALKCARALRHERLERRGKPNRIVVIGDLPVSQVWDSTHGKSGRRSMLRAPRRGRRPGH